MNYVDNFVGHFDLNQDFIKDVRKLLRKSGFRLWVRGGNPNRKQHTGSKVTAPGGITYTRSHADLRQTLPLVFSTYGRFYLRSVETSYGMEKSLTFCKGLVADVAAKYQYRGINLRSNVPTTL